MLVAHVNHVQCSDRWQLCRSSFRLLAFCINFLEMAHYIVYSIVTSAEISL